MNKKKNGEKQKKTNDNNSSNFGDYQIVRKNIKKKQNVETFINLSI